ncbi:hypothetical protein RSJ42_15505 [Methanosarcina hadiensis]|uniref:hypothetical protein n=1 Tax=Methanosarcina hadiensis TaxID=3078083 RepID=UPI0039775DB2
MSGASRKDTPLQRRDSGISTQKLVLLSEAKRTAYSRGAIREGQRTPEAQFGKDSVLPRRNSGRTAYCCDYITTTRKIYYFSVPRRN